MRNISSFLATAAVLVLCRAAHAEPIPDTDLYPGGKPENIQAALLTPDCYAWQLFLALNRQADADTPGKADTARKINDYEPDKPVVWETWAQASGGRAGSVLQSPNYSELFLDKGGKPTPWASWKRQGTKNIEPFVSKRLAGAIERSGTLPVDGLMRIKAGTFEPLDEASGAKLKALSLPGNFTDRSEGEEVRMNEAGYNHVRDHELYNIEGLESVLKNNQQITFPNEAQEVKANWVKLTPEMLAKKAGTTLDGQVISGEEYYKRRYHWRTIEGDASKAVWILTGFHVITRDLPNWFWCDFEHEDYQDQAEKAAVDNTSPDDRPQLGYNARVPGKWSHYILRGTQIDFTTSEGIPTILANTQIEKTFQQTSSCISCHANASISLRTLRPAPTVPGNPPSKDVPYTLPVFVRSQPVSEGPLGVPNAAWFYDNSTLANRKGSGRKFVQTDFLWSLPFRALSTQDK